MRPALLLTGPPAAGKSTTALAPARATPLGAIIDVDDIRHLVVAGHAAPWEGDTGRLQQQLGVDNACDLARRFYTAGLEVVLADLVTTATAAMYRRHLPDLQIIRLRLPLGETRQRARRRPLHITEQEFEDPVRARRQQHLPGRRRRPRRPPRSRRATASGLEPVVQAVDELASLSCGTHAVADPLPGRRRLCSPVALRPRFDELAVVLL